MRQNCLLNRKNASLGSTEDMFLLMDWEKTYSAEKNKKMIDDEKKQPSVTRAINRMCHVRNEHAKRQNRAKKCLEHQKITEMLSNLLF